MSARWQRLQADLAAAGIDVDITTNNARSSSIWLRHGDKLIQVGDRWWRKNADIWIGWQVDVSGADDLLISSSKITKKRSEVVAAVRGALNGH